MKPYRIIPAPTRIPVPGGKVIEEHYGKVSSGSAAFSVAHMVAPPGWSEPAQIPEFGELTLMVRGRMRLEIGAETLDLSAGQTIWIEPRVRVRYSNPFEEPNEYYAFCLPAFSPELAHRDPA